MLVRLPRLVALLALAMAAPSAQAQRAVTRAPACGPLSAPSPLPAVSQLLDSAAAAASLGGGSLTSGESLLSLAYDGTGAPLVVQVIETVLEGSEAELLATVIASLLQPMPGHGAFVVRLRIGVRPTTSFVMARSEYCAPAARPSTAFVAEVNRRINNGESLALKRGAVHVRVDIDATGVVTAATLVRSSRAPIIDGAIMTAARELRYVPARVDGRTVASADTLRFSIDKTPGTAALAFRAEMSGLTYR